MEIDERIESLFIILMITWTTCCAVLIFANIVAGGFDIEPPPELGGGAKLPYVDVKSGPLNKVVTKPMSEVARTLSTLKLFRLDCRLVLKMLRIWAAAVALLRRALKSTDGGFGVGIAGRDVGIWLTVGI